MMKRIMGLMLLVAVLMVPTAGFAASDQLGIYVAPKFVYGLTQMNNVKHNYTENYPGGVDFESYSVGDKHDNTFGGSLAIGYDFDKMFEVPVRAEIEYSIFFDVSIISSTEIGLFLHAVSIPEIILSILKTSLLPSFFITIGSCLSMVSLVVNLF